MSVLLENGLCLMHCEDLTDSLGEATIVNNGVSVSTEQYKFGKSSLYFNGNSYLSIKVTDTPCTLEFWAYILDENKSSYYPTIFSSAASKDNGGTYMHVDDDGDSKYPVYRANQTNSWSNVGGHGDTIISRNEWHHIVLSIDGSAHYFFLDGVLQQTVTQSSPHDYTTWYFGGMMGASSMVKNCYFNGYIDEIIITSKCKYKENFTVPTESYIDKIKNINIGDNNIGKIYLGNTNIIKAYLRETLIFRK